MTKFKSHFGFSKKKRIGIFLLVIIICSIQLLIWSDFIKPDFEFYVDEELIALNKKMDSIHSSSTFKTDTIYPFNPNFIDDYKGYVLGLNTTEIDKLLKYRSEGNWINSTEDFKRVTGVDDSLLHKLSKSFEFPDWIKNKTTSIQRKKSKDKIGDLNTATKNQLISVYGIGEKLSQRIINYRDKWGGFLTENELYLIYGLDSLVINRIKKKFKIFNPRNIEILNINKVNSFELVKVPFIDYELAFEIVDYRKLLDGYTHVDQIKKVKGFPLNKFDIIKLYLVID